MNPVHNLALVLNELDAVKIKKVPQSIKKYGNYFNKLDYNYIFQRLQKLIKKQIPIISQVCIDAKGVNVDELQQIHNHMISVLGKDIYLKILADNTENYNLFRTTTSIIATYAIIALYAIYKQNTRLLVFNYYSYGIYTYTKMFEKYIKYCSPNTFEQAIMKVHGLSVYKREFKKEGHFGVIDKFVKEEVLKLVKFINEDKFNQVVFTRSFTYIKHRMNQSFKSFSQVFHKIAKQKISDSMHREEGVSSTQIGMMINQILEAHNMTTAVPDQYIAALIKDTNINFDDAKDFINTFIKLSHSNAEFKQLLHDFYKIMFRIFIELLKDLCDVKFLVALYKITVLKNGSTELVTFKSLIDKIIMTTVAHSQRKDSLSKYLTKTTIATFRKFFLRFLYYVYIKGSLCR